MQVLLLFLVRIYAYLQHSTLSVVCSFTKILCGIVFWHRHSKRYMVECGFAILFAAYSHAIGF